MDPNSHQSRAKDDPAQIDAAKAIQRARELLARIPERDGRTPRFGKRWATVVLDPCRRAEIRMRIVLMFCAVGAAALLLASSMPLLAALCAIPITCLLLPPRIETRVSQAVSHAQKELAHGRTSEAYRSLESVAANESNTPDELRIAACALWGILHRDVLEAGVLSLQTLLIGLGKEATCRALDAASSGDADGETHIIAELAQHSSIAMSQQLASVWQIGLSMAETCVSEARVSSSIVCMLRSLNMLPEPAVPLAQVCLLLANTLVQQCDFEEAEHILASYASTSSSADHMFLLAEVQRTGGKPDEQVLNAYRRFVDTFPQDVRAGSSWRRIGDLHGNLEMGMSAIEAYEKAESLGTIAPELRLFRIGAWDALPFLRNHRDYLFPVVVCVDTEVDPAPGAKPGERLFEVGAARFKGSTCIDTYRSYVQRHFSPSKAPNLDLSSAPEQALVAEQLTAFLGNFFVVGHNVRDFDAEHLRSIGVNIESSVMLDTLRLARLLYPDSSKHNLDALGRVLGISVAQTARHTALPDAHMCGQLLHSLGDELVKRGGALLDGIRALTEPGSSIDRVLLEPRGVPAAPQSLRLDPAPSKFPSGTYTPSRSGRASSALLGALGSSGDALVEIDDPGAAYASYLSALTSAKRCTLSVATRSRVERALYSASQNRFAASDLYVLPNLRTLLCPLRMQRLIEETSDPDLRLTLFCLYQASHNHDVATLYPFRMPDDQCDVATLRSALLSACCLDEYTHSASCPGHIAAAEAKERCKVLITTHKALLAQSPPRNRDLVVIDDIDSLASNIALWSSTRLDRDEIAALGPKGAAALQLIDSVVLSFVEDYESNPEYHSRLPLRSFVRYNASRSELTTKSESKGESSDASEQQSLEPRGDQLAQALAELRLIGAFAGELAHRAEALLDQSQTDAPTPHTVHAHWVDVRRSAHDQQISWALCGVSADPQQLFRECFWEPYGRHIVCGSTVALADSAKFLEDALGLPRGLQQSADERDISTLIVPDSTVVPSPTFLNRRRWSITAGTLLYRYALKSTNTTLVTLNSVPILSAIAAALKSHGRAQSHLLKQGEGKLGQVLATSLGWSVTKIEERLTSARRTIAVVSPRVRREMLDAPVDIEISGPLRFANPFDPIVAAYMRVFANRFPAQGPFSTYLLPQCLMELKNRLASPARTHIVLDSRLFSKGYRDEIMEALQGRINIHLIGDTSHPSGMADGAEEREIDTEGFVDCLNDELSRYGLMAHSESTNADLDHVLRTVWDTSEFRTFQGSSHSGGDITQRDIVRGVLEGRDQLLLAATGGGKSLCFQLPAVLFSQETLPKVTLVFSPLIALMSNQVDELNRKGVFSAIILNSTLSPAQRDEHLRGIKRGDYSIIYLAPEQIHSPALRRALEAREIGLVAVDEAHCLSQWGHDFRTDYFALSKWIRKTLAHDQERTFPILALTATARPAYIDPDGTLSDGASTVDDIVSKLNLRQVRIIQATTKRSALKFRVEQITPKETMCSACGSLIVTGRGSSRCQKCGARSQEVDNGMGDAVYAAKLERLLELVTHDGARGLSTRWQKAFGERQRGLVYCAYRDTTMKVAAALGEQVPGLRVQHYHAGMQPEARDDVLKRLSSDGEDGLDLVVATNAFGMGIDVRRLGYVVHYDAPGTLEAYYQEAGRAGRDSTFTAASPAECILLYHSSDLDKQRRLSRINTITEIEVQDVYEVLLALGRANDGGNSETSPAGLTMGSISGISGMGGQTLQTSVGVPSGVLTQGAPSNVEVMLNERDLALLAGIDEGEDGRAGKVKTILYYLEYHAQAYGKPVIEREESASHVLQLRLSEDFRSRVRELPEHSPSHALLSLFLHSQMFRLSSMSSTSISLGDLKGALKVSYKELDRELLNLVRRRIIEFQPTGRIRLRNSIERIYEELQALRTAVGKVLVDVDSAHKGALRSNQPVYVDLREYNWGAMPMPRLARFLFYLSQPSAEPLRVFRYFRRAIRYQQPGKYEIQLWDGRGERTVLEIVKQMFAELRAAIQRLGQVGVSTEWQLFNTLQLGGDYAERLRFNYYMLALSALGLIDFVGDTANSSAVRLRLLQPSNSVDDLQVDMGSLRLKETYDKHKLKLIERYATLENEFERTEAFEIYFDAREPIIEKLDSHMRSDMTTAQSKVVELSEGYHLVEGSAGCGKTTALVEHVKHLVYNRHVPLDRIMLTTYYNSAVGRIERQMEDMRDDSAASMSMTINSFGHKIFSKYRHLLLRTDGRPLYAKEPRILTGEQTSQKQEESLVSKALAAVHSGVWPRDAWPEGLAEPALHRQYKQSATAEELCWRAIMRLREYGVYPSAHANCQPSAGEIREALLDLGEGGVMGQSADAEYTSGALYAIYSTYLHMMGEVGYLTFDDQILFALAILRTNADLVREYRRFFEHVIVDELQDFTPAAAALFSVLTDLHPNVVAFGDQDQAIRVRATKASDLFSKLRRADYCGAGHRLEVNFRSTQEIVDLATGIRNHKENPKNYIQLRAARGHSGDLPLLLHVRHGSQQTPDMETQVVAALDQIAQMPSESSTALIVPYAHWRHKVEGILHRMEVPFSIMRSRSKYQLAHVNNVIVYHRLIVSPSDVDVAHWLRYCLVPYVEAGQIETLQEIARSYECPLLNILEQYDALRQAEMSEEQRLAIAANLELVKALAPSNLCNDLERALRALEHGPIAEVKNQPDKLQDIEELFAEFASCSIATAVEKVSKHILFLDANRTQDKLVLTSIDDAKSEEFDNVVLLAADQLNDKQKLRCYVTLSRARDRVVMLCDDRGGRLYGLLRSLPSSLYRQEYWPPKSQGALASSDDYLGPLFEDE